MTSERHSLILSQWFLLFQLFTHDGHDGTNPTPHTHPLKSLIIGEPGPWIPFPSHSLLVYLGPKVLMLALDCRAERKLTQVVTRKTYDKCLGEVRKVQGIEQLVMLLGVPIGESSEAGVYAVSNGDLLGRLTRVHSFSLLWAPP